MITVALIGYGKMGRVIENLIDSKYPDMKIGLKINSNNRADFTKENLKKVDVAIEFSTPEIAYANIMTCFEAGIPVVCGTTGWTAELNNVKQLCNQNNNALLYASNFSIGVNIFFEINKRLAQLMSDKPYELRIDETHHLQKHDKPSGTAITLADTIVQQNPNYQDWQLDEKKISTDIPVFSHRVENIPGTHTITYSNDIDQIEITHTAFSRDGFAHGAIQAARWLIGKQGFFEMRDVLSL